MTFTRATLYRWQRLAPDRCNVRKAATNQLKEKEHWLRSQEFSRSVAVYSHRAYATAINFSFPPFFLFPLELRVAIPPCALLKSPVYFAILAEPTEPSDNTDARTSSLINFRRINAFSSFRGNNSARLHGVLCDEFFIIPRLTHRVLKSFAYTFLH